MVAERKVHNQDRGSETVSRHVREYIAHSYKWVVNTYSITRVCRNRIRGRKGQLGNMDGRWRERRGGPKRRSTLSEHGFGFEASELG